MIAKDPGSREAKQWEKVHAAKIAEQAGRIPTNWALPEDKFPAETAVDVRPVAATSGILSDRELKITGEDFDATSLAAAIAAGQYSAVEVATAFAKRAAVGHQICNNLTEISFSDAIEDAKKLDAVFNETGKTVGPLHGLPMTFKVSKGNLEAMRVERSLMNPGMFPSQRL